MLARVWQNLKVETGPGADAAQLADAWRALGASALDPAAFQSVDYLLPILEQHSDGKVITVRSLGQLIMAVPAQSNLGIQSSFASPFVASGLPQVLGQASDVGVMAFVNSLKVPFRFRALPADSKFFALLQNAAPQFQEMKRWQRAALLIRGTYEQWLVDNLDQKRRKEFKRLRTRLSEQGEVKLESLSHSSNLDGFVNDLLELEGQGWKGSRGTAMNADQRTTTMFRAICANLHHSGSLRFWTLKFNGKPIASLFGMIEGAQGWIVKIAYDEAFAKFSPGVMLVFDATEALFAEPQLKLVDSCAIPGHPMIDRIWRDRIDMVDVLVAPAQVSQLQFATTVAVLKLHAKLRDVAKSLFYRISKRKKS